MKRSFLFTIALFILPLIALQPAFGKVVGKTVEYSAEGTTLKGYLAYDDAVKAKRPGVLVVHEWWGLNDYIRKRADMLAGLGYVALALDMYGQGKVARHPDEAGKFSSELMKNFTAAKKRFLAAEGFLKKEPTVDPGNIAAIGYCFGGGVVLNMAAQGADVKGVVSFHGTPALVQPPKTGDVKAKILVLHGGDDKFSTPEQIDAFKNQMNTAGADYQFIIYPGAMHAFTNPDATATGKKFNIPLAYSEKADKESWAEMRNFLNKIFKH
jgi:dienelactone hydrolase